MDLNSTAKEMAPFNVYPLHPVTLCFASSAKSTARTAGTAGPDAGEREVKYVIKGFDSRTRPWQYIDIYIYINKEYNIYYRSDITYMSYINI